MPSYLLSVLEYNIHQPDFPHLPQSDFALKYWQRFTDDGKKGMKEAGTSNVSHVSRKPLQCIAATTPVTGHVVEVKFSSV